MELWIPVIVAAVGGGGLAKLVDVIFDKVKGRTERRRAEVDRIAKQLHDARRREHLTLVWGRRLELLAVAYGVPEDKMPVLDLRNDPEEVK